MYEINFIAWPLVYGMAGHAWGTQVGVPLLGAVFGAVVGFGVAIPMIRALFYDVEILAPFLLILVVLVPGPWRRWYLSSLCLLPWIRLAVRHMGAGFRKGNGGGPAAGSSLTIVLACACLSSCAGRLTTSAPAWAVGTYGFDGVFTVRNDSVDTEHVDSVPFWGEVVVEDPGPTRAETSLGPCEVLEPSPLGARGERFTCGSFVLEVVPVPGGISGRLGGDFLESVRVLRCAERALVNDRMACVRQEASVVARSRRLSAELHFVRLR